MRTLPRSEDPRITIRLSRADHAALSAAAASLNVETGGLIRAAAVRGLAQATQDVREGRLTLRRRGRAEVVPEPVVQAVKPQGPDPAEAQRLHALTRQQRLNRAKGL